jgi:DNA-binding response OmpR family regulator
MSRILVVEGDPSVCRLVALVLRSEGFEVSTARDGLEGLHQVTREPPDLVVLDLSMPNVDGRTFVTAVRHMGLRCQIMILSADGRIRGRARIDGRRRGREALRPR